MIDQCENPLVFALILCMVEPETYEEKEGECHLF